ncbi:MAG: redoxin domain-containing protein [bacterium]
MKSYAVRRSAWKVKRISGLFVLLTLGLLPGAMPFGVLAAPSLAPVLELQLPTLDHDGHATIGSHLRDDGLLVLVVWNSDCPSCLQNVVEANYVDLQAHDTGLLGVNFDEERWQPQQFVQSVNLAFPQLHDAAGLVATTLGADDFSFSFVVLDGAGNVLAISYDSVSDGRVAIEEALATAAARQPRNLALPTATVANESSPAAEDLYPLIRYSGQSRVRWLSVALENENGSADCPLGGPYGEELQATTELLYRLTCELEVQLDEHVTAGGLLRLSNEDPVVFEQGPQYLSSEIGSAFVELRRDNYAGRVGYYDIAFTPLTLMRWDAADNPPLAGSGGAGGCGVCSGAGRSLSLEALDELEPEVTFEGARVRAAPTAWFNCTGVYARPRQAQDWSAYNPDDEFSYRQNLLGGRVEFSRPLWGTERVRLGATYVNTSDDSESANWPLPPQDPYSFFSTNEVYSCDLLMPLLVDLSLRGELARSYNRTDRLDQRGDGIDDDAQHFELAYTPEHGLRSSVAWLKLGADFGARYGALSYLPNKEGMRLSSSYHREEWGVSLFYKRLNRVRDCCGGEEVSRRTTIASGLASLKPRRGLSCDLAVTITRELFDVAPAAERECEQSVMTLFLQQALARGAYLAVEYTWIVAGSDSESGDPRNGDPRASIGSVLFAVDF